MQLTPTPRAGWDILSTPLAPSSTRLRKPRLCPTASISSTSTSLCLVQVQKRQARVEVAGLPPATVGTEEEATVVAATETTMVVEAMGTTTVATTHHLPPHPYTTLHTIHMAAEEAPRRRHRRSPQRRGNDHGTATLVSRAAVTAANPCCRWRWRQPWWV